MESFCSIIICNFFISAFSRSIFCFDSYSCSRESYKYL